MCRECTAPSSFGAKKNAKGLSGLDPAVKVRFETMNAREEDIEWAERHDITLSMKVRVPSCDQIKNGMEAVVELTQYHINRIDLDKKNNAMFLYLTEVRKIG